MPLIVAGGDLIGNAEVAARRRDRLSGLVLTHPRRSAGIVPAMILVPSMSPSLSLVTLPSISFSPSIPGASLSLVTLPSMICPPSTVTILIAVILPSRILSPSRPGAIFSLVTDSGNSLEPFKLTILSSVMVPTSIFSPLIGPAILASVTVPSMI